MDRCKTLLCFGLIATIVGLVVFLVGFGTTYFFHAKANFPIYNVCKKYHDGLWMTCYDHCDGNFKCVIPDDVKDNIKAAKALEIVALISIIAAIASTAMAAWKENTLMFVSAVVTNAGAAIFGVTGAAVFVAKTEDNLKNSFPIAYYDHGSVKTSTGYSLDMIVASSIISFGVAVLCACVWVKKRRGQTQGEACALQRE